VALVKKLVFVCCFLCTSCAYELGSVRQKPGVSQKDADVDQLICERTARNHPGADGAEWIPFAGRSVAKHIRREEFKHCMEAKGYEVIPPK
jgi:hypothetical protein